MIVQSEMVGKGLKLWSGEEAILRGQWEEEASLLLWKRGFRQVYTPYVHTIDLHTTFLPWLGKAVVFRPMSPSSINLIEAISEDEAEKIQELAKYVYMGHKGANHAVMMQEGQLSYNDLPLTYFEFAEVYDLVNGKITNDPGLYLSVMCEPRYMEDAAAKVYAAIAEISCGRLDLITHGIRPAVASGLLSYIDNSGKKAHGALILARAKFRMKHGTASLSSV